MNYRSTPYLRLLLPFVAGLLLANQYPKALPWLPALLLALLPGLWWLSQRKYAYTKRGWYGMLLWMFLALAGYCRLTWFDERQAVNHFSKQIDPEKQYWVLGLVNDAPSGHARIKIPLQLEAIADASLQWKTCSGNVLLLVKPDSSAPCFRYGNRLLLPVRIRPTEPPQNPQAFDYQRYLHHQNIHFQSFVDAAEIRCVGQNQGRLWWQWAFASRERLLGILHRHFPGTDEFAVASALLVGYKDDLSDEIRMAYAQTGSMHALAVSGTHVGLLYAGLLFLLNRFRWRGQRAYYLKTGLILLGIWAFALITGATGSVMRASLMFSFFLLGRAFRRESSVWNSLAASAFALLLFNPGFLFDAGFQLSYAAVAGMVFFYPRLYRHAPVLPRWPDEAMKVLFIGIAAQMGTLPLSLYYFHQFPVYFWLSGWVVVLGGALFLWGASVMVMLDFVLPQLANYLAQLLYWLLKGMNESIFHIQALPGSVVGGIWISGAETLLLYTAILCWMGALTLLNKRFVFAALGCLLLTASSHTYRAWQERAQAELCIYHHAKGLVLDATAGFSAFSLEETLTEKQMRFIAESHRLYMGADKRKALSTEGKMAYGPWLWDPPFLGFFDKRIAVIQHASALRERPGKAAPVDLLLLNGNPKLHIADCLQDFSPQQVILGANNSSYRIAQWKKECAEQGIPCYSIADQSAFVLPLNR